MHTINIEYARFNPGEQRVPQYEEKEVDLHVNEKREWAANIESLNKPEKNNKKSKIINVELDSSGSISKSIEKSIEEKNIHSKEEQKVAIKIFRIRNSKLSKFNIIFIILKLLQLICFTTSLLDRKKSKITNSNKIVKTPKFRRWGKIEDCEAFILLKEELARHQIDEDSFFQTNMNLILDHHNQIIKDPMYNSIAQKLVRNLSWTRTPYHFLYRIFKLSIDQTLSFRDKILLRRLTNKMQNNQIDFESVASYFPGKTHDVIRDQIDLLLENDEEIID